MSNNKKVPLLSIIIPALNTKKFYKACLKSLLGIDYPNYEILIIDDGSTDGSYEAIKKMSEKDSRLRVIQTLKRKGIPASRNLGLEVSRGELIAFFDMDMEVTDTWPSELVKVLMSSKKIGAVLPKVMDFHKRNIIQSIGGKIIPQTGGPLVRGLGEKDTGQYEQTEEISVNAAGLIVKREVAIYLKGYDETLGMYDDIDFGWRLWLAGWKSYYVPKAVIYHWTAKGWEDRPLGSNKYVHEYYLDNVSRMIIKNFESRNILKYLPQALVVMYLRVLVNLLRGNVIPLLASTQAVSINLLRLPETLKERKEIQDHRKISDKEMMGPVFVKGSYFEIYRNYIRTSLARSAVWHQDLVPGKTGWRLELQILLAKMEKFIAGSKPENKHKTILDYQKKFGIRNFIETGTYTGDMVDKVKGNFEKIISIEIDRGLSDRAKRRFSQDKNVEIIHGDSIAVLKKELPKIKEQTIFWLDAHCCGGITAMSNLETPVKEELKLILEHEVKNHIILLDDADLFVGTHDYPKLNEVRKMIKKYAPKYKLGEKDNVICLVN